MSRPTCVPMPCANFGSLLVLPACPSSRANVLICCLVQPDGLLPPRWRKMGGGGLREGEEVTCRDLPSLKIPLPKLHPQPCLCSFHPPSPKHPSNLLITTCSDTRTLSASISRPNTFFCADIYFLSNARSNPSGADSSSSGVYITGLLACSALHIKLTHSSPWMRIKKKKKSERRG